VREPVLLNSTGWCEHRMGWQLWYAGDMLELHAMLLLEATTHTRLLPHFCS
jgi:hypothetical protein